MNKPYGVLDALYKGACCFLVKYYKQLFMSILHLSTALKSPIPT